METPSLRRRIMIVDSDRQFLDIERTILERHGYIVCSADSAESAMEAISVQVPDAVLLDINVSGTSSFDLLRHLREDERTQNLPVILLSSNPASMSTRKALTSGANDFVPKPVDYEILLARLQNQLDARDRLLRLELRLESLLKQGSTDPITSLSDGPFAVTMLEAELRRAARYGRPLSFMLIEVDPFEKVTHEKGEEMGDLVLQHAASVLSFTIRSTDVLSRFRNAVFGAVLPETDPTQAMRTYDRLIEALEFSPLRLSGEVVQLSASAGITSFAGGTRVVPSAATMVAQTELALENARAQQINRVRLFDPSETRLEDSHA